MTMAGTPVGRMFHFIAPRLLRLPWHIPLLRPTAHNVIAVEAYPALVVKAATGQPGHYKNDNPDKQTLLQKNKRSAIARFLQSDACVQTYKLRVSLSSEDEAQLSDDPTGDAIDSVLCAVQAAWSYTQRDNNWGIPVDADPLEGWIVDPNLLD